MPADHDDYLSARVFCEWANGAYISSLAPNFTAELASLVKRFGPPATVEFRPWGVAQAIEIADGPLGTFTDDEGVLVRKVQPPRPLSPSEAAAIENYDINEHLNARWGEDEDAE